MTARRVVLGLAAALAVGGPALAHHSAAMFDRTKKVTVTGVVKDFQYVQPHSWIDLMVPDASGQPVEWSFEAGAPMQMKMVGLTPSVIRVGDKVTVTGYPLRDGRPGASFIQIVLPSGRVVGTGRPPDPTAPPTPSPPAGR
jgi:hypothetical protein